MPVLVELHPDSPVPAYRQIADSLRRHLVEGRLKPGALLPPIRQLAIDLGVHFNTVAQAYRLLSDEGWLDLRRRRGAMVVERGRQPKPDPGRADALFRRMAELTAELRTAGVSQSKIATVLRRLAQDLEPERS
jgi:DNA-binding transcriptional regulator YhcF (GntR family)